MRLIIVSSIVLGIIFLVAAARWQSQRDQQSDALAVSAMPSVVDSVEPIRSQDKPLGSPEKMPDSSSPSLMLDGGQGGPRDEDLDQLFAAEVVEKEWAAEAESAVFGALSESGMSLASFEAECRASMCRIVLIHPASRPLQEQVDKTRQLMDLALASAGPLIQSYTIRTPLDQVEELAETHVYAHRRAGASNVTITLRPQ